MRPGSASAKLVLLGLASCADANHCAHPSVQWLCDFSDLNRKTVIAALSRLETGPDRMIEDTGDRRGRTRQVKVYRLAVKTLYRASGVRADPVSETVPKAEQSQKRNSSGFSRKESQKRDTEPFREPIPPTPAKAGAPPQDENREEGQGGDPPEPPPPPDPPPPAEARGTRLPADWCPPPIDELQPMARKLVRQWPAGAYEAVSAAFCMHWQGEASARGVKRNWPSTHAKWLINDHAQIMRAAKAGVSFAALAPDKPAPGTSLHLPPVPEQMIETGTAEGLRAELKGILGERVYAHWFGCAALLLLAHGELRVVAPSPFAQGYIAANFETELKRAAQRAGHPVISIKTVVTEQEKKGKT